MILKPINIESTDKALSALGGLCLFDHIYNNLDLHRRLTPFLPKNKIKTPTTSSDKFKALVLGFIAGADCLDANERLGLEEAFVALCGKVNAANTYGEYLRAFTPMGLKQLNHLNIDTALRLRKAAHPKAEDFVLCLDSTDSKQSGEKMQGLAYNYKKNWGLDYLCAFDQFGYQYWMDVRPGATYTSNGAPEVIHSVFKKVERKLGRFLLGDSGYCNVDAFNAARCANASFVIAMKANMYEPLIRRVKDWKPSKKIQFYDGRDAEIGDALHYPVGGNEALRVVFIRALRPKEAKLALFDDAKYDYHAWITNIGHHEKTNDEIILFYRTRGNCENFIRELKYGLDLKHFPCQKLIANKAYGMIAAFAYNLMRYAAFVLNPKVPHFAKIIRFRMVNLACQVVQHARSVTFRFPKHVTEEVNRWMTTITSQFASG